MKKCPQCNSTNVSRIPPTSPIKGKRDHGLHVAGHAYRSGHPIIAAIAVAGKIAKEAGLLDWLDSSFRCNSCGHTWV